MGGGSCFPHAGRLVVSLTTFCIVSVASLVLLRATLVKTFRGNFRPAPSGTEAEAGRPLYAGRLASVTQPLEPGVIGEIALRPGASGGQWQIPPSRQAQPCAS